MKKCTKCDQVKPLSDYHKSSGHKQGVRSDCKDCVRERVADRWVLYRYGLDEKDVEDLLRKQAGCCDTCGVPANADNLPRHRWSKIGLCIDHDHETGKVRGLLCHSCNTALGMVKDNVQTLRGLSAYLERHGKI